MNWFKKNDFNAARQRMLCEQMPDIPARVLSAMAQVPRHGFVPEEKQSQAYADMPLPIGHDQTISQPYIVGLMTAQLDPQPSDRILEIGTGSGYQTAVLAELVEAVYSIEIIEPLAQQAEAVLCQLDYHNIHLRIGDGATGWPEAAPFDGVIATCAPETIPGALVAQLKDQGRLVIPIGPVGRQELLVYRKHENHLQMEAMYPVRFVPMTGLIENQNQKN